MRQRFVWNSWNGSEPSRPSPKNPFNIRTQHALRPKEIPHNECEASWSIEVAPELGGPPLLFLFANESQFSTRARSLELLYANNSLSPHPDPNFLRHLCSLTQYGPESRVERPQTWKGCRPFPPGGNRWGMSLALMAFLNPPLSRLFVGCGFFLPFVF